MPVMRQLYTIQPAQRRTTQLINSSTLRSINLESRAPQATTVSTRTTLPLAPSQPWPRLPTSRPSPPCALGTAHMQQQPAQINPRPRESMRRHVHCTCRAHLGPRPSRTVALTFTSPPRVEACVPASISRAHASQMFTSPHVRGRLFSSKSSSAEGASGGGGATAATAVAAIETPPIASPPSISGISVETAAVAVIIGDG